LSILAGGGDGAVSRSYGSLRKACWDRGRHHRRRGGTGISKQLVFTWRKLYREGRFCLAEGFVPATIMPEASEKISKTGRGRIEIVSANGRRIIVDRDADIDAVLHLVRGLEALP
jgi:hypothetical protein